MSDRRVTRFDDQLAGVDEEALEQLLRFPFVEALFGRRSRRFFLGAEIPDGPLAYRSRHEPAALSETERLLILTAVGGNTGWHNSITRHDRYAPALSNYPAAAGGRTFPSAAGFHTAEIVFTDDSGTYIMRTRDAPALTERGADGQSPLRELLRANAARIRKIEDERIWLPPREPYMEGHNSWVANRPGSLLAFPIGDVAQHAIANLCFFAQNGYCVYDDVNHRQIPGLERFRGLVDVDDPLPLTFLDQYSLTENTAELSTACYAGALMQQALGLGGWMFNGIDRLTILGASGDPEVPGLRFRYDEDERWSMPNPTGRDGVFAAFTPPHFPDMRAAVEAFCERKFGPGGPFHPDTPGPWKDSRRVRAAAAPHPEPFRRLVATQAQYVYDTFGKWPATVPSVFVLMYLQTHHLDLDYYDALFAPGAYLKSHAEHFSRWHGASRPSDAR
jgi:hypothetical protein